MRVTEINERTSRPTSCSATRSCADSLLIGANGERIISKVVPSYVYNTVDQPIFPTTGKRFSASVDLAGIGGNTNYYKPMVEGVMYLQPRRRLTLGMRAQAEFIRPFTASSADLPIFREAVPRRRIQRPRL